MSIPYLPGEEQYKNEVRHEFSFLLDEYGFEEIDDSVATNSEEPKASPLSIKFEKKSVFVAMDGIGFGWSLGVFVGRCNNLHEVKESFPLEDIISFRNPEMLESGFPDSRSPQHNLKYSALALRSCAGDFLNGDFSALPDLKRHIHELDISSEVRYADFLVRKATEAYQLEKYREVIEIFQPYLDRLDHLGFMSKFGSAGVVVLEQAKMRLNFKSKQ